MLSVISDVRICSDAAQLICGGLLADLGKEEPLQEDCNNAAVMTRRRSIKDKDDDEEIANKLWKAIKVCLSEVSNKQGMLQVAHTRCLDRGVPATLEAALKYGIRVIPGFEISTILTSRWRSFRKTAIVEASHSVT
ncbi:hypothetical protein SUGI_1172930 [Cryptomeria japonica]|nr:hypothetical protein SUGI_1172930 [Cryptomeria japonica]